MHSSHVSNNSELPTESKTKLSTRTADEKLDKESSNFFCSLLMKILTILAHNDMLTFFLFLFFHNEEGRKIWDAILKQQPFQTAALFLLFSYPFYLRFDKEMKSRFLQFSTTSFSYHDHESAGFRIAEPTYKNYQEGILQTQRQYVKHKRINSKLTADVQKKIDEYMLENSQDTCQVRKVKSLDYSFIFVIHFIFLKVNIQLRKKYKFVQYSFPKNYSTKNSALSMGN